MNQYLPSPCLLVRATREVQTTESRDGLLPAAGGDTGASLVGHGRLGWGVMQAIIRVSLPDGEAGGAVGVAAGKEKRAAVGRLLTGVQMRLVCEGTPTEQREPAEGAPSAVYC